MERTENERLTQLEAFAQHFVKCGKWPADACEECKRLAQPMKPDPEQTPFQAYMAEAWPDINPGSAEWVAMRKGWNAMADAALPTHDICGDVLVSRDAILALKEPVV